MGAHILRASAMRWECPNCTATAVTAARTIAPGEGTAEFHMCRGLRGVFAPMIPAGTKCKVEAVEREDYVGTEHVQKDGNGRPIMAVRTVRDDGIDCAVMAPAAVGRRS